MKNINDRYLICPHPPPLSYIQWGKGRCNNSLYLDLIIISNWLIYTAPPHPPPLLTYNGERGMRCNNFYFVNGNSTWSILQENAKTWFLLFASKNLCLSSTDNK